MSYGLDRLARNPVDAGAITWLLQTGILKHIKTFDGGFYPTDNVLLMSVEFGIANQYIIDLRKNCMRGMIGKAERGWLPSNAPLGYVNDKLDRTIKVDTERFPLVHKMWEMLLSGNYTPQQIRKIANNEWGLRTAKHTVRGGNDLSNSMIYKLFGNIFYTGLFKWHGKLYEGNHAPMITLAEFDKAQLLLGRKGNPRPQTHSFAYTGLLLCNACGLQYTASEKQKLVKTSGEYKTYTYYHCTRKRKDMRCANAPVTLTNLEAKIDLELEQYQILPEFLQWGLEYLDSEKGKTEAAERTTNSMQLKSVQETQKELDTLTRMRYRELIDDEAFIKERDVLKDKITILNAQMHEPVQSCDELIDLTNRAIYFAAYARDNFIHGSIEGKREIVSCFGSNYVVKDKILLFEASVWLIPIGKAYPELLTEYRRLELQKYLEKEVWNAELHSTLRTYFEIIALSGNNIICRFFAD